MQKKIPLGQRRFAIASYSVTNPRTPRWLVYVPESAAEFHDGHRREIQSWLGKRLASQFNFLILNKPGIGPKGLDRAAFEQSFRRDKRVQDALTIMDAVIPLTDDIYLVGYSEGAYLAPQIAELDPRVEGIVMIGGGTRGWLKEELSNAGPREKTALRKQIKDIYSHPRSLKKWNGFSYATWFSYRDDRTLSSLRRLHQPVLAILGARDRTIDFRTTSKDLRALSHRQPLQVRIFKNCGHSFVSHWADAWYEVRRFLNMLLESPTS
jgi:pimeloyl-ACP methyl ester carboxylesterase